jgi:hypothetical protein
MKGFGKTGVFALPLLFGMAILIPQPAAAQGAAVPIIVDTAVPIIVNTVKPKPKQTGLVKFEGYVQNANIAEITLRAKRNETNIQTFALSTKMSEKMQKIVDKGGFQYGDKVTILYDPTTMKAMKFKGKASKPV